MSLLLLTPAARPVLELLGRRAHSHLPLPRSPAPLKEPTWAEFMGSASCAECHRTQYETWRRSTHGRAGGPAETNRVLGAFDGRPLRFRDATVTPQRGADGSFVFVVERNRWSPVTLRVDGIVGGGHLVGGGTQAYFSRFPDGTVRYLPFDYHPGAGVWFCDALPRAGGGWVPVSEQLSLGDCKDWPPTRVMGTGAGLVSCQECHGSQIEGRLVGGEVPYRTRWTTLAINCESCHGPGREHVARARGGRLSRSGSIGMEALNTLSTDASLAVCFRCHALKKDLGPTGYLPGKPFTEFYALLFSQLGDQPFFPDGRIRTFAYQENHLASDCYLSGSMTCVDCHEPHGQGYRDQTGKPLESRFSDGQCLGCHASKADRIREHTHHRVDSKGSRCVYCHMPYLQHPGMGKLLRFARSDHTIPIPRPTFDASLGLQSACAKCHTDYSIAKLDAQVQAWYGELKPLKDAVTGLLRAEGVRDRTQAAGLLLHPGGRHPMAQFAGLARFMEEHLGPDMTWLEPAVVDRLAELARSSDLDVQALALAALHLARGRDPEVRALLARQLRRADARAWPLRRRWVLALGYLGDVWRRRGETGRALATYAKALEVLPDDARLLVGMALAHSAAGRPDSAILYLERSLARDPLQPLALADLGALRARGGDLSGAKTAIRRALKANPWEPTANIMMGHLHRADGRLQEAIAAYRRAAEGNPGLIEAHLTLASALLLVGERREAAASAQRALDLDPDDPLARQVLAEVRRSSGSDVSGRRNR